MTSRLGDDDESDDQPLYDDMEDEDEFGLPSLSSMRREGKRIPGRRLNNDPGGSRPENNFSTGNLNAASTGNRARANSSDIAMERGPPSYPVAKKSEGKILRPQYKDILRGWFPLG